MNSKKSSFISQVVFILLVTPLSAGADYCPTSGTSFDHVLKSEVSFDQKAKDYTYRYILSNQNTSLVPIDAFYLILYQKPSEIHSPTKHWHTTYADADEIDPARLIWQTFYSTAKPNPKLAPESQVGVPDEAIRPGKSVSNFSFKSSNPPGIVQYYVEGFQELAVAFGNDKNEDPDINCPNLDSENPHFRSIPTGMTVGPADPQVTSVKIRLRKKNGHERCGPIDPAKQEGQIAVLVMSTKAFDAGSINVSTVKFGPDGASPLSSQLVPGGDSDSADEQEDWEKNSAGSVGKVESNSHKNLLLTFDLKALGIKCVLDKALFLTGKTADGKSIVGGVTTKLVGCDTRKPGMRKVKPSHKQSS